MTEAVVRRTRSQGEARPRPRRGRIEPRAGRLGPLGRALLLLAPLAASGVFLVWTRVTSVRLGYELARAHRAVSALEEANRTLATEVSALRSPERLEAMAEDFGLLRPKAEQIRRLREATP